MPGMTGKEATKKKDPEQEEEEELVVSTPYIEHWNDLIDLWYLGMQVCLVICNSF